MELRHLRYFTTVAAEGSLQPGRGKAHILPSLHSAVRCSSSKTSSASACSTVAVR